MTRYSLALLLALCFLGGCGSAPLVVPPTNSGNLAVHAATIEKHLDAIVADAKAIKADTAKARTFTAASQPTPVAVLDDLDGYDDDISNEASAAKSTTETVKTDDVPAAKANETAIGTLNKTIAAKDAQIVELQNSELKWFRLILYGLGVLGILTVGFGIYSFVEGETKAGLFGIIMGGTAVLGSTCLLIFLAWLQAHMWVVPVAVLTAIVGLIGLIWQQLHKSNGQVDVLAAAHSAATTATGIITQAQADIEAAAQAVLAKVLPTTTVTSTANANTGFTTHP